MTPDDTLPITVNKETVNPIMENTHASASF